MLLPFGLRALLGHFGGGQPFFARAYYRAAFRLGYSLYSIFGKFAVKKGYGALTTTFYTFLICAGGAAFCGASRNPGQIRGAERFPASDDFDGHCHQRTALFALYLRPFGITPGKASIFASIEPVVAMLLGLFFFGEALSFSSVIGIALVLAAVALLSREK